MIKMNRLSVFIQVVGLIAFCAMAAASASSQEALGDIDVRGAAVGGIAGYNGYIIIGRASSESDAKGLARSKGYSVYIWDSINGAVYAK